MILRMILTLINLQNDTDLDNLENDTDLDNPDVDDDGRAGGNG